MRNVSSYIKAVDGVSFDVPRKSCVGLVGESGSGKSTIGKTLIKLVEQTEGTITYDGHEISSMNLTAFHALRKRIQMIFQDPFNSLNPRMRVHSIIGEALDIHFPKLSKKDKEDRIIELLELVGLAGEHRKRFPHEFSGGQRQRIGIARALAVEPEFLICDEPVSALDVSVQAQIVNLLQDLQEKLDLTYLFISHDLAVVKHMCTEVLVMSNGKLVESGNAREVLDNPQDPYTQKLLAAVPSL